MIFEDYNNAICELARALANGGHYAPISPKFWDGQFVCLELHVTIGDSPDWKVVLGDPEPVTVNGQGQFEAAIRLCAPLRDEDWARTWDVNTPAELVRKVSQMKRLVATAQ